MSFTSFTYEMKLSWNDSYLQAQELHPDFQTFPTYPIILRRYKSVYTVMNEFNHT